VSHTTVIIITVPNFFFALKKSLGGHKFQDDREE